MKILLVEDDMEISSMLKSFLMTENYEVWEIILLIRYLVSFSRFLGFCLHVVC